MRDASEEKPAERVHRVRADCAQSAAACALVRPPVPGPVRGGARVRAERKLRVAHAPDLAAQNHVAHLSSRGQKSQLVVNEREPPRRARTLPHRVGLLRVHRHRLLAQHGLARVERRRCYLRMRHGRRRDAHQINVVARHDLAPVRRDHWDVELARRPLGVLPVPARYRHDARALARAEGRKLRRAREARADDADADCSLTCHDRFDSLSGLR